MAYSPVPFPANCGAAGASGLAVPSGSGLMGMNIVEGAGYVLDARSGVSTFMNRFETAELTGVDFPEMRDILSRAIDNLEKAKASYVFIKFIAKNTPYRGSVISKDLDLLLAQLTELKSSIDGGRLPEVQKVWKLNQTFTESVLFGQYFSQVLYRLLTVK